MLCPKCNKELIKVDRSYKCPNNHSYDIAKEGYVNLLLSRTNAGDSKELVNGRISFLNTDVYDPLRQCLAQIIADFKQNKEIKLLDMGCGTGYYTKKFSEYGDTYGLDISKDAVKYASKHDKNTTYLVASSKSAPFPSEYFDVLVHIFSPIFENEDSRLLKNEGIMINVEGGPKHLIELKNLLYKNPYLNEEKSHSYSSLKVIEKKNIQYTREINNFDIHNLVMMTPYFYTTKKEDLEALNIDKNMNLTIDFLVTIFKIEK